MPATLLIKGGRIVDPANGVDATGDLLIEGDRIVKVGGTIAANGAEVVKADGQIVFPGFVDLHVHLRSPGREEKETVATGTRAAAKGGFTTICAMANTDPPADNRTVVEYLLAEARRSAAVTVLPIGAVTKGLAGESLAEIGELKAAGVVALSDDGHSIMNAQLMRRALEYAKMFELPIISHAEDTTLSAGGLMHEGLASIKQGVQGIPSSAEAVMVARDILLAEHAGARLHIAHASAKETIDLLRAAKQRGVAVTAEATPHHLALTDEALRQYESNCKMNPPLRAAADQAALHAALRDGTIDCVATDHAPHTQAEKEVEMDTAPFGVIGLETALGVLMTVLVKPGGLTLTQLAAAMSWRPAQVIRIPRGTLSPGAAADVTLVDPGKTWTVTVDAFESKSSNSPFIGRTLHGAVTEVFLGGRRLVHNGEVLAL
ncbi:MAG: dihydroorotase [Omnitrophica WOR_2 bacterium RIFCSPHIGHO2_02_FULL_68_15]|nr:MAG: dihydroorotase [Omnitrophica WOR_2 bacterium RIFCSPHIGHO2_02_FULL_68_15]